MPGHCLGVVCQTLPVLRYLRGSWHRAVPTSAAEKQRTRARRAGRRRAQRAPRWLPAQPRNSVRGPGGQAGGDRDAHRGRRERVEVLWAAELIERALEPVNAARDKEGVEACALRACTLCRLEGLPALGFPRGVPACGGLVLGTACNGGPVLALLHAAAQCLHCV